MVVVFLVALFAMGALSIDVGNAQLQRKKIHEGTDAAALAAVPDWWITGDKSVVDAVARAFATTNGVKSAEIVSVKAGKWENGVFVELANLPAEDVVPAVQVIAARPVKMVFAQVIGFDEMNPTVESVAVVAKAYGADCAVPWAACDNMPAVQCTPVTLQISTNPQDDLIFTNACTDSSISGNFGLLSFPGSSGGSDIARDIRECAGVPLTVGQCVGTATGKKWGPIRGAIRDRLAAPSFDCAGEVPAGNGRVVVVPKIAELPPDLSGSSGEVCITGFYTLRLDGYTSQKNNHSVNATFIKVFSGNTVSPDEAPIAGEISGVALVK